MAVSLAYIWKYMANSGDKLKSLVNETTEITGFDYAGFIDFLKDLGLLDDLTMTKVEFEETIHGVNTARLQNFPMKLTDKDIENIYSSFILVK